MLGFYTSGIGGARRSQSVASLPSRHTAPCKVIGCAVCRATETACMETQLQEKETKRGQTPEGLKWGQYPVLRTV